MVRKLLLAIVLIFSIATPVVAGDSTITGIASWYQCTRGWCDGTPTVALAGFLGGRYTGHVNGYVNVCGDRCVTLPVVDYCQCYEGTPKQRVVDLNKAAWKLVTDKPYSAGLVKVTMTVGVDPVALPNTATSPKASTGALLPDWELALVFIYCSVYIVFYILAKVDD